MVQEIQNKLTRLTNKFDSVIKNAVGSGHAFYMYMLW